MDGIRGNNIALKWKKEGGGRDVAAFLMPTTSRRNTKNHYAANDIRLKYEERKTATREGVAVYKQANRDKSPKVTYSVPAV